MALGDVACIAWLAWLLGAAAQGAVCVLPSVVRTSDDVASINGCDIVQGNVDIVCQGEFLLGIVRPIISMVLCAQVQRVCLCSPVQPGIVGAIFKIGITTPPPLPHKCV